MLFLLSGLLIGQAAAISCDANNPCPWFTFAQCCANVCWTGSLVSKCQSPQCTVCMVAAEAAVESGGQVACDAAVVTACEVAGGGPEDPIADICAGVSVAICTAVWNLGLQDPEGICASVHQCPEATLEEEEVALPEVDHECMDCIKDLPRGVCHSIEIGDYTQVKKLVPERCVDQMARTGCQARVQENCNREADIRAKQGQLAQASELTGCKQVGDTWDYCRWGPLLDPKGVEIVAGSSHTFTLDYSSQRFHWRCSGADEYSRVDRANTIQANYQADGHIHYIGMACSSLDAEMPAPKPEAALTGCVNVGQTSDYCRWGPLIAPDGQEIVAGGVYTFNLNYSSERFNWKCSGSDEYSRIDRANTIEAHYQPDGRINWVGKACSSVEKAKSF